MRSCAVVVVVHLAASCSSLELQSAIRATLQSLAPHPQPPTLAARVVKSFPHDRRAFTQGLHFEAERGTLLESTGMYGRSTARRVRLESGRIVDNVPLRRDWFGEGIAKQ